MVTEVEKADNTLKEARERITKLMKKRNGKEYDFDARYLYTTYLCQKT